MAERGRYRKGAEREREIVLAVIDVFAKGGYTASVREIADAVGLTQPGLLHYFSSKEELFVKVLQVRDELELARSEGALVGLREAIEANARVDGLVRLFTNVGAQATSPEHVGHDYFRERYVRGVDRLAEDIGRRQAEGLIADGHDPRVLARVALAVADGSQIQWLLDPDNADMLSLFDEFLSVLMPSGDLPVSARPPTTGRKK